MSVIQSYTINPVLKRNKKSKKTGLIPIYICLYIDGKQSFRATSYKVTESQWLDEVKDDKGNIIRTGEVVGHPNAGLINANLRSVCSDLEKEILAQNIQGTTVSRRILKVSYSQVSLSKFAKEVRGDNKITNKELNRIINFFGSDPFLSDINAEFLRKFQKHEKDRGLEASTIHGSFKFLRRICNQATTEGLFKKNPMGGFLMPKYVQPDVTWLVENEKGELIKLIDEILWPAKDTSKTAKDMCIVAVYFAAACYTGLRHSDWHKTCELPIINNNLFLRAKKNGVQVSLPVGNTLRKLLKLVKQLPEVPNLKDCNDLLKVIGTLAKLKKELTTHVGRHSFGCMCASLGIPREITAELMGIGLDTVAVYYHITGAAIETQASKLRAV